MGTVPLNWRGVLFYGKEVPEMLKLVQFFVMDDVPDLPVVLVNCGHQSLARGHYRFDGRLRRDTLGREVAIWQYTLSGRGCIEVGGERRELTAGDAFLVTVPDDHAYYLPRRSSHWEFLYLTWTGRSAIELGQRLRRQFGVVVHHPQPSRLVERAQELLRKYDGKALPNRWASSALGYELWMVLAEELHSQAGETTTPELVVALAEYLRQNPDKSGQGIARIAAALGYSRAHFTRRFTAECGISPARYLLEQRLRLAAQILGTTRCQVKDVAWRTGFTDVSHFCRVFRRRFQVSPEIFRNGERPRG